ncbi:hypothetical protein DdX_17489 [Ditylenchus destructor]|uniref:Uncharacterized protein n=1 Tax=Ditylenchus destructor TaxID=166010 RepID=A0AAD4QYY8_9BILA|nr:hypothetical protein DdX_17489 [Ditylenchus destructor]
MDDSFQLKTATEDTSLLSLVTPDSRNSDATQSLSSLDSSPNVSVVLHGQVLRMPFADRRPNARRRLRSHSVGATPIRIVHRGNPFRRQQEIAIQNVAQVRRIVRRHSGNARRNPRLEMTLEDQIAVDPENFMFQPMCNGDQYDVLPLHPPHPAEFIEHAGNTPVFARSPERFTLEDEEEEAVTPLDDLRTAIELLALSATPRSLSPVTAKALSVRSESSLSSSPV